MRLIALVRALLIVFVATALLSPASAQDVRPVSTPQVDVQKLPPLAGTTAFDPHKAVEVYLSRVSGAARAKSDAYFEGGYVLQVVDILYALAVAAFLLWGRVSAYMRDVAAGWTRSRFWQVPLYVGMYAILTAALTFPLTVYEGFFREHAYGLSNQTFLQWFGDEATGFSVLLPAAMVILSIIYSVIRAAPRTWWVWGGAFTAVILLIQIVITPVFLAPLFNHYRPLAESPIKDKIESMARSNGIPATNVYEFDASRQSSRISANVSGFLGTTQISITDNLLKNGSPAEIQAVLGHEMGHYVLDHQALLITWISLMYLVGFAFLHFGFLFFTDIFGGNWDIRSIDDPAGLAVLAALLAVFTLIATPVQNTIVRTAETQADMYGLNTARQPDAFATVALKLSTYRKLDPSPLEEFVFYDHPSGRTRIWEAMRWKAEHLNDPDIKAGPVSPQ